MTGTVTTCHAEIEQWVYSEMVRELEQTEPTLAKKLSAVLEGSRMTDQDAARVMATRMWGVLLAVRCGKGATA